MEYLFKLFSNLLAAHSMLSTILLSEKYNIETNKKKQIKDQNTLIYGKPVTEQQNILTAQALCTLIWFIFMHKNSCLEKLTICVSYCSRILNIKGVPNKLLNVCLMPKNKDNMKGPVVRQPYPLDFKITLETRIFESR